MWIVNRLEAEGSSSVGWHAILQDEGLEVFIPAGIEGASAALTDWTLSDEFNAYGVREVYEAGSYIVAKREFNYIAESCDKVFR